MIYMSNVDISYGELILIDTFDAGAGIVGAAQAAVAYAIQKDTLGHQPLVAISAETFYFSNNLSIGGQIDLSGTINFNVLDVSGDATLDASLNVKGNSYLRGKLEVNEIGALEKATTGGVATFRLANIDNISDISYALQQMKTGETAINSGNNLSLKIGGDDMLSINAAGNVGIGTTTPSKSLEVVGDISCQTLYANKRVIETRLADIINFDVGDRMYHSNDNNGGWGGSGSDAKYIPLARMINSNSMTVKGVLRHSDGRNVCFMDLLFSARYSNAKDTLHVQGTITGKVSDDCKLVLFQRMDSTRFGLSEFTTDSSFKYEEVKYWLYLVTKANFTGYSFNIGGTNVKCVWPGPTDNGLDEHPTNDQLSFPQSRGAITELGEDPHSLDLSFNSDYLGIRTMYTSTNFHERIDNHIFIDVIYHDGTGNDTFITKFPADVSCADLYSNNILTPSGNNKLYIIPNRTDTADTANRVIHFGLMGADNNTGELRLGRQHADNRYHSIKVESDPNTTDNLMHFYLHYGTSTVNNDEQVNVMTLRGDGNVGIGTTTPSETLDVSGNIKCTDISCADLYSNNILTPSGNNKLYIIPNRTDTDDTANRVIHFGLMGADNNTGELRLGRQHADNRYHSIKVESDPNTTDNLMHFYLHYGTSTVNNDEQVNVMTLRGDGNVGIGTTTPSETLDVSGNIKCTDISCADLYSNNILTPSGNNKLNIIPNSTGLADAANNRVIHFGLMGTDNNTGELRLGRQHEDIRYHSIKVESDPNTTDNLMHFYLHYGTTTASHDEQVNVMTLRGDGNVGIGTTTPSEKLDVSGTIKCTDLKFTIGEAENTLSSVITGSTNFLHTYSQTDSISLKSDVGQVDLVGKNGIWLKCMEGHDTIGEIHLGRADEEIRYHTIEVNNQGGGAVGNYMAFKIHDDSDTANVAQTEVMTLRGDGNVGIGTTTPSETLDVSGNIKCTDLTIEGTLNVSNRHLATFSPDTGNFHGNSGVSVYDYHNNFTNLLGKTTAQGHGGLASYQLNAGDNAAMSIIISSGGSYNAQVRNIQGYDTHTNRGNNAKNISLQLLGGNVGIGTRTPSETLDVSGNIKCTDISCADLYSNNILTPSGNNKLNIIPNSTGLADAANNRVIHFGLMGTDNNTGELRLGRQHEDIRYHSIKVESDPNTTDNLMHFYLHYGTTTASHDEQVNVMTLRGDGNVGIGTTTPSEKLDVSGTIKCTDLKFTIGEAENTLSSVITGSTNFLHTYSQTDSISLKSDVGQVDLVGKNGIWLKCMEGHDTIGEIHLGRADEEIRYHTIEVNNQGGGAVGNYMAFKIHDDSDTANVAQTEVMTLRGDGNVGIGATNPSKSLEVVGDISCQSLYFENIGTGFNTDHSFLNLNECLMKDHSTGGALFKILCTTKNLNVSKVLRLNSNGVLDSGSDGGSDDRIKFDETIVTDCMTLVNKLVPKRYNIISEEPDDASGIWIPTDASWNDVSNNFIYNNQYGFIAQEVRDISGLEMLIDGEPFDKSGNQTILSLEYNSLFTIGIGAIKELHQLILSQAATISALEARVIILENP